MADAAADALALALRDRALVFVDLIDEAGAVAAEIADLEAQLRAAECAAGLHHFGPEARELAAEIAAGYLRALQPHLQPLATREAADRAAEELCGQ